MTQSGRNMNHVGQSISLYPMTPKRSSLLESISMVFFLMGNDSTKNFYCDAIMTATLISCAASSYCCWLGTNCEDNLFKLTES